MSLFYIASPYSLCGNCVSWWAEGGHGYTSDLTKAWQVDREKAQEILSMKRGDKAYPVNAINTRSAIHFDAQRFSEIRSLETVKT